MNLDEYGEPGVSLMHSEETDKENYSKIWFYLNPDERRSNYYSYSSNYKTEAEKFHEGIKRRTAYFTNLVYDFDESLEDFNKYQLITGKTFKYHQNSPYDHLHLIIKNVPYEIDWTLLGIPKIQVPLGLIIEEGIIPLPTRETYTHTDKVGEIIKKAISLTATEIVELANKQRQDVSDWKEFLRLKREEVYVNIKENKLPIKDLLQYSKTSLNTIVFTSLKDVDTSNLSVDNIFPIECTHIIKSGRKQDCKYYRTQYPYLHHKDCLRLNGGLIGKKNTYIYSELDRDEVHIFKKKNYKLKAYKSLLNLKWKDKENWRKYILQYQNFVDCIWKEIPSYEDIVIDQKYLESIKVKRVSNKPTGAVTYYELSQRQNYSSDYNAMLENKNTLEFNHKSLVIYGEKDDRKTLDNIWSIYSNGQNVKVIALASSNFKYLEDNHQYVHMKNWHKTKSFSRAITAYKIHQLLDKYKFLTSTYNNTYGSVLIDLSSNYQKLLLELSNYANKHCYKKGNYGVSLNNDFMEACMKTADTEKLWDYSVYYKIDQLNKYFEVFKEVSVFKELSGYIDLWKPMYANYIKKVTKSLRLDLKWYQQEEMDYLPIEIEKQGVTLYKGSCFQKTKSNA